MKSYGRAPTFLLLTGYEQVRSVVAALAGDETAARNVELVLPETGVCQSDLAGPSSCCSLSADASPAGASCGTSDDALFAITPAGAESSGELALVGAGVEEPVAAGRCCR